MTNKRVLAIALSLGIPSVGALPSSARADPPCADAVPYTAQPVYVAPSYGYAYVAPAAPHSGYYYHPGWGHAAPYGYSHAGWYGHGGYSGWPHTPYSNQHGYYGGHGYAPNHSPHGAVHHGR